MGLIPDDDRRPRDWTYLARFDRKDLPSLQEMARHIRETHDIDMIEDFNRKCEQKLAAGESPAALDNGIEIQTVTKTGDLVVDVGLRHCINIVLGITSARWSYFGLAQGTSPLPAVTDTALNGELVAARVPLAWSEPAGMRIYFGGISSQTDGLIQSSVGEIGVYNSASAGAVLFNRSYFPNNIITNDHTTAFVAAAPTIVSAVIEFCPIG